MLLANSIRSALPSPVTSPTTSLVREPLPHWAYLSSAFPVDSQTSDVPFALSWITSDLWSPLKSAIRLIEPFDPNDGDSAGENVVTGKASDRVVVRVADKSVNSAGARQFVKTFNDIPCNRLLEIA